MKICKTKRGRSIILAAVLTVFMPEWLEAQLVINFDTDPSGVPIPAGTVVNSAYASRGIMLEGIGPPVGFGGPIINVYANSDQPFGFGSPPNSVMPLFKCVSMSGPTPYPISLP